MLVRLAARAGKDRRGVILLVVLALLTLFAILGLSFVSYSDAEATSARIYRESLNRNRFGGAGGGGVGGGELAITLPDATALWTNFLGQLIYDLDDDNFGVYSVLRGHSLARTMYGWDPAGLNDKPYAGTGRLRETGLGLPFAATETAVNYQFGANKLLRDPGRLGVRANLTAPVGALTGDLHVSYTYADHNNMFLAVINPTTGNVVAPSYHRQWFGGTLTNTNANWTNAAGRYLLMRPRPVDMGTGFPLPASAAGDVVNLDRPLDQGQARANDSIWLDINSPINTAPDGRKYKMLIAPCIIELDGRINVNTASNLMATLANGQASHSSNQGWGPWEVNLARILNAAVPAGQPPEWHKLFLGDGSTIAGRYGNTYPNPTALPQGNAVNPGSWIRGYSPADYNGINERWLPTPTPSGIPFPGTLTNAPGRLSPRFLFPLRSGGAPAWQLFPSYSLYAYNNGVPHETHLPPVGTGAPTPNHASMYNAQRPQGTNRNFGISNLVSLLRRLDSVGDLATSELLELMPRNLDGTGPFDTVALGRRNRLTTHSFDLDRSGSPPYIWDPNHPTERLTHAWPALFPIGPAIPFRPLADRGTVTPPVDGEYDVNWRNKLAALPRIELNRQLTDYPIATGPTWQYTAAQLPVVRQALADRQALASDIFDRLVRVTGAVPRSTWPGGAGGHAVNSPEFRAVRWLAQLAVNIVDYVDNDDFSTPLQFHTNQWVFGTEMPRLVLNEYYAQWDNDPTDAAMTGAQRTFRLNFFAELHNPFPKEPSPRQDPMLGDVRLQSGTTPIYKLLVCRGPNTNIRLPENHEGIPDTGNIIGTVDQWGTDNTTNVNLSQHIVQAAPLAPYPLPATNNTWAGHFARYRGIAGQNQSFYVVGPGVPAGVGNPPATPYSGAILGTRPLPADATPTLRSLGMSVDSALAINPVTAQKPSLVLQRLANPYLPPQPNAAAADYNPYITVDYVHEVNVVDGRVVDQNGPNLTQVPMAGRASVGRWHPFAATQWRAQEPLPIIATQMKESFFRTNAQQRVLPANGLLPVLTLPITQTIQLPFDLLTHNDRQVNSVAELLHVSGFKPHELTQMFMLPDPVNPLVNPPLRFRHRAPWTEQSTRIYRLWDHLTIRSRAAGVALGGRVPGKVNVNAIREALIMTALADGAQTTATGPTQFTNAEASSVGTQMINQRGGAAFTATNHRPFLSMGAGHAMPAAPGDPLTSAITPNRGVHQTLLRSFNGSPTLTSDYVTQQMFEPTALLPATAQPLRRFELLAKTYNNLTTRSHVFGVWVTVGFFEVLSDPSAGLPVRLGAEMQWPTNGVIRHRMFAVIDRSNLQVWPTFDANNNPVARLQQAVTVTPPQTAVTAPVTLLNAAGAVTTTITHPYIQPARTWTLQANAVLTIDPDTDNEETVVVRPRAGGGFEATFAKSHAADAVVISRGNPGPWRNYNPAQDVPVVPFQTVLE